MERVGRFNPMQSVNMVSYPQLHITTIPTLLNNHTLASSLNSAFFRSFAFLTSPANMSDQTVSISYVPSNYDSPSSPSPPPRQTVKLFTAATLGLVLLLLSGLTMTGTVMALIIATPLLVLFSPILVPAGLALFILAAGFLFAGGCGVAAIAALSWIYNYVAGKNPLGSDRIDFAGAIIADKARDMKARSNQGL